MKIRRINRDGLFSFIIVVLASAGLFITFLMANTRPTFDGGQLKEPSGEIRGVDQFLETGLAIQLKYAEDRDYSTAGLIKHAMERVREDFK